MSRRPFRLLAAPFAAIALCAAVSCARPTPPSSRDQGAQREAGAQSLEHPARLDTRTRGWDLGVRYLYTLKLSTMVRFGEGQKSFDFDITGDVELIPVSATTESVTLYMLLGDARSVSRLPAAKAELDALAAELRSAAGFAILSGGRLSELRVPVQMSQMAVSTYRQIAAALQFVHAAPGAKRYSSEEYDTTGKYVAEYELSQGAKVWRKTKQRYLGLLGYRAPLENPGVQIIPEVVRSQGEIRLDAAGRPESVKLLDELSVKGAQTPVHSSVAVGLESKLAAPAPAPNFGELLAGTKRLLVDEANPDPRALEELDKARIGTLTFETIVSRLEQLGRERKPVAISEEQKAALDAEGRAEQEKSVEEDARLFGALSAIFRTDPRAVTLAVAKVRAKSPASNTLLDALGSASTPDTHRALATLLGSTAIDRAVRDRIVLSLARARKPTSEAIQALKAILERDKFHEGALYGLGTYARRLRDEDRHEEAKALGEFLVARLALARGPSSLVTVLRAIANSGYAGALARVRPFFADERERVRAAAMNALQSMRDPSVDGIIASRLDTDSSNRVRLSAIETAGLREPSQELATALAAAGTRAADPHVRYRAVELMARWLPKRPNLRAALEQIAKNDAEPRIRARAQTAL